MAKANLGRGALGRVRLIESDPSSRTDRDLAGSHLQQPYVMGLGVVNTHLGCVSVWMQGDFEAFSFGGRIG